ncbi:MAG: 6-phosphogluconate dehydrogenase [Flavobacteriales bacterium]
MKKIFLLILVAIIALFFMWLAFIYYVPYSEGTRSGELIKISHKGVVFKTWEGEISQGISGAQIFSFSVLDKDKKVIKDLQEFQGNYVKLKYIERYATFSFWGDTNYFVTEVKKEKSPHFNKD